MTFSKAWSPTWKAEEVLGIPPDCKTCSAQIKKGNGRLCHNPIHKNNRYNAGILLRQIPAISRNPRKLDLMLEDLAACLLCRGVHIKEALHWDLVLQRWTNSIERANQEELKRKSQPPNYDVPGEQQESKQGYTDAHTQTGSGSTRPQGPRSRPSGASAQDEKQRREFERQQEAKRQAKLERERQKAKAKAQAEEETRQRQRQEHSAREEDRRREERRQQEYAKPKVSWELSWELYRIQLRNFKRLPSATPASVLTQAMPRPLRGPHENHLPPQDQSFEREVEAFFKNMPDVDLSSVAGRNSFRRKLKLEGTLDWHSDKIVQHFPHLTDKDEAIVFANSVMSVITRIMANS
ncbi:uncharacterized protein RHO25_008603 [Cercospora beticola]|uniref:Reticulocyte-binding protein 2 a n=1 Tax=Cercospora beticola TaxID=122368 RepID=A0ABZ0NWK9_CERBT|nr:hypothetical protein RHO25_008603 [Cercospora beticola]CAK1357253.1 unnamed protein product [Cercospora beticola]